MEEPALTNREAEALVREEFAQVFGRVIYVDEMVGYYGDEQADLKLKVPVAVKITGPLKPEHGLYNFVDDWVDPNWDFIFVDRNHPEVPDDFRAGYIAGHSVNLETGERQMAEYRFETWRERTKRWWTSHVGRRAGTTSRGE